MTDDLYFSSIKRETIEEVNAAKNAIIRIAFLFANKNEIRSMD